MDRRFRMKPLAWRLLLATLLLAVWLGARDGPSRAGEAADPARRVVDPTGVLPPYDQMRMSSYLEQIEKETTIDIRLLFAPPPGGRSLDVFAAEEATRLGIGRETGLRGVLVVYDPDARRLRVELGYGLEEYFPDAFVGRLIEDQVRWHFQEGDPGKLHLMLRIMHWRIRDHMLGGRFDPLDDAGRDNARHVSGGAGASARIPLPPASREDLGTMDGYRSPLDPAARARFGAQPTPEAVFDRYLDWLGLERLDPYVGLFTPTSQAILWRLQLTPPYHAFIRSNKAGQQYRIVERGDRAILYFTSTPLVSPLFFRLGADGWALDIDQEAACSQEYVGGSITWTLNPGCAGLAPFQDLVVELWTGTHRIQGGDNRPVPTPAWREQTPDRLEVRRRDPSVLAAPSLPAADAFGYPPARVGKLEILALLHEREWDALADRLDSLNRLALRDVRYEFHPLDAYRSFEHPDIGPLLDEWLEARPGSPEMRIARAHWQLQRAWDARGTEYARATPRAAFRRMEEHVEEAHRELDAALALDERQPVAYEQRIWLHQLDGDGRGADRALDAGLGHLPLSVMLREARIRLLWPRWGGSLAAIRRVAEDARPYMSANPRLRTLLGQADYVRGYGAHGEEQLRAYDRALAHGDQFHMLRSRGRAHARARSYELAIEDFDRAWTLRPESPDLLYDRARSLYWLARRTVPQQREPLLARAEADAALAQAMRPDEDTRKLLDWIRSCRTWPEGCDR